jgi:hypothetical protein
MFNNYYLPTDPACPFTHRFFCTVFFRIYRLIYEIVILIAGFAAFGAAAMIPVVLFITRLIADATPASVP